MELRIDRQTREEFKRLVSEVGARRALFAARVVAVCDSWGAARLHSWIHSQAILLYRCHVTVGQAAELIMDKLQKAQESEHHRHEIRYCNGNLRGSVFSGMFGRI
jgi:hypothetical protein